MAQHDIPASMLKESLDETLEAISFCIEFKKTDEKWGEFKTGGCLGFPGSVLLFSIIDTIGSYFRKNAEMEVLIDNKKVKINAEGWEHFKILNSKYFNQNLSEIFIKKLYSSFRSKLTHNSILGDGTLMVVSNERLKGYKGESFSFIQGVDENQKVIYIVSLTELYHLCQKAVSEFKNDIDDVVPTSKSGRQFT